ncbi:unnamed protein product [Cylindrotheca closterium]|uniref:Uncharacterized protein n=1 Tax=Cylindrotheca closterium TaxID=2856 RepID=A0AAD2G214_9STRA|nr:unnamed protein product [Cylindrotheca closterium]
MNDPPNLYRDPDYQIAQGWPFEAAQQAADGNIQALLYLAFTAFNDGNGSVALKHYRKAARDFNNLEATLNVIKIYEFGQGVGADLDIIVNYGYYMLGARTSARDGRTQIELPENKRNVNDGLKWLERAAQIGRGDVASNLGNMYMTGGHPKVPRNYEKGMELLEKAAELGDGHCAYQLSISYKIGIIPVDEGKHRFWLKKAADMAHEEAVQEMARVWTPKEESKADQENSKRRRY